MKLQATYEVAPEDKVRHFFKLLAGVTGLFISTEIVAWLGVVPELQPVRFGELSANILFAIGFGCPIFLYCSSLPRIREVLLTALAGGAISIGLLGTWALSQVEPIVWTRIKADVVGAHFVTGLGLASLGTLVLHAWRRQGAERVTSLLYLLPAVASLVFTLEVGVFFNLISSIFPFTNDYTACAADAGHGVQISFVVGRLFQAWPWLAIVCFAIYVAPPPGLVFVYALQVRARKPPPVDVITVLLFLGLVGYSLYFIFPVAGPRFAYGDAFPQGEPWLGSEPGRHCPVPFVLPDGRRVPRDCIPSLHMASVILAFWHAKPHGKWARLVAGIFLVGTLLATLGLGEHYLVDLVIAFPYTLAVHAACTPGRSAIRRQRWIALLGSIALLIIWYELLLVHVHAFAASVLLTWLMSLGTVASVVWLEHQLSAATFRMHHTIAEGPYGHFILGNLIEFRRHVLRLLLDGRARFGDVVRFRLGPMVIHLVSHPEHIKQVLVTNQHHYDKSTRSSAKIQGVTGAGLLTSNGPAWLRQRRLVQPAFHPQRVAGFTGLMTAATAKMLDRWQMPARESRPIDVASEMTRLTYTIVARSLFGVQTTGNLDAIELATATVMERTWQRLESLVDWPLWVPTPANRRFRMALGTIDVLVRQMIRERKSCERKPADLLTSLLEQCGEENGQRLSEEQVRNETITLLLAGHETTANALTWTWYLLAKHPQIAQRVRAEVLRELDARAPTYPDLVRLELTTRVLQESMRLYPPIWIMERHVLEEDVIGGYTIPKGSSVVLCPYVTHRHPEFWDNAECFDPDRFLPERCAGRHHYAYFPFGGGQRLCVGNHFAMTEALVILAMVLSRYRLELQAGFEIRPKPGITLRTETRLPMRIGLWP